MKTKAWVIKKLGWHAGVAQFRLSLEGGGFVTIENLPCTLREYESRQLGEEMTIDIKGWVPAKKRPN